jgi:hypothetical protein
MYRSGWADANTKGEIATPRLTFGAGRIDYGRKMPAGGLLPAGCVDISQIETTAIESRRKMGILWEIVQTGLMYGQKRKSDTVEDRVQALEDQLRLTQNTLRTLVRKIEEIQGLDIDGDGRVG